MTFVGANRLDSIGKPEAILTSRDIPEGHSMENGDQRRYTARGRYLVKGRHSERKMRRDCGWCVRKRAKPF